MEDYKIKKQGKKKKKCSGTQLEKIKGDASWKNTQFDCGYVGKIIFSHTQSSIKGDIKILY